MYEKNILVIGPARFGKTSLAKKLSKEYGYNLISIDDIVSALEVFPSLEIGHNGDELKAASNIAPFLMNLFVELSEGSHFYDGVKFVIEGTHIDFEQLIPFLRNEKLLSKYEIIGLTYNNLNANDLYKKIKEYDTEDDWTYWCSDEELKGNVRYFIERNKYFNEKFSEYNIKNFNTSNNRDNTLEKTRSLLSSISGGMNCSRL